MADFIPLSGPDITEEDIAAVVRTMRSGRLSLGPRIEQFEQMVASRAERTHGIAVSSGTAGLHLALAALGVGPGDEVITPAFSFIASANCILYTGARPVFVDCDPRSLNMRPEDVEAAITGRTKAIIAVEVFGNPKWMPEIAAIANKHEIPLVEDCCEALGGRYRDRAVGSFGRVGVFGFYPNKQITTGEGGMIVTDEDRLADICRALRNQGRTSKPLMTDDDSAQQASILGSWLSHELIGYNYRLSELQAALGVSQMRRLDQLLEARQRISEWYTRRLMQHGDLIVPAIEDGTRVSWFVYVVRLSDQFSIEDRDAIIQGLHRHEVGASNYFPPIPLQPAYRALYGYGPGDFPAAESVSQRTIALPFFPRLTEHEVDLVCQTLELMISRTTFARR